MIRRQLLAGLRMTVALIVVLGLAYPLLVTVISGAIFGDKANGSLVKDAKGQVVGSSLIGQNFTDAKGNALPQYFQPRPSAAGTNGYDAMASSSSNLGPSNPDLIKAISDRVQAYRTLNGLAATATVPADAVTASGSGLDPDISVANADLQAARVAQARHVPVATVLAAVKRHTQGRTLGFLGQEVVHVLELNLDLDRTAPTGA